MAKKVPHLHEKGGLCLTCFILETLKGVLAKSAEPDQMQHNVASAPGLHYFVSCAAIFQQECLK